MRSTTGSVRRPSFRPAKGGPARRSPGPTSPPPRCVLACLTFAQEREGLPMRRILVVANQTLLGDELLGTVQARREQDPETSFHLLVPATHPKTAWSEG